MGSREHVVVIGAGVIGLSTAISLLDHPVSPCDVTLIAADLPPLEPTAYSADPANAPEASYASAWAGAHHVSDAKDSRQLKRDQITFEVLKKLTSDGGFGGDEASARALVWVHQTEYWEQEEHLNLKAVQWYPDYQTLPASALPEGVAFGCTFTTLDFVVPQYLSQLYRLFLSLGGRSLLRKVHGIPEAIRLASQSDDTFTSSRTQLGRQFLSKPNAVLVSPGLGARQLLADEAVHPVRGQTLLIRSRPFSSREEGEHDTNSSHKWHGVSKVNKQGFRDMYIIPRGDGTSIIGGTRVADDWSADPNEHISQEILQRTSPFLPIFAGVGDGEENRDVEILGANVGLRPARTGGIRLEQGESIDGLPVVYSYGYGGYGYQCSWGAAFEGRDLIDQALGRTSASPHSTLASLDKTYASTRDGART